MKHWICTILALFMSVSVSHAASVNLSWVASGTSGVTGYRIYYGTTTGVYTANVNAGLATTGTVGGLTDGTTYYMVVRAYKATNQESVNSNQVTAAITITVQGVTPLVFITPQMHSR